MTPEQGRNFNFAMGIRVQFFSLLKNISREIPKKNNGPDHNSFISPACPFHGKVVSLATATDTIFCRSIADVFPRCQPLRLGRNKLLLGRRGPITIVGSLFGGQVALAFLLGFLRAQFFSQFTEEVLQRKSSQALVATTRLRTTPATLTGPSSQSKVFSAARATTARFDSLK